MPDFSLDTVSIASPCSADWNTMSGDHQKRFCQQCQLNVYNLSGMTREAAEELIAESEGRLCVRFFRRADGTLLTQDCPVRLKALHRRQLMKGLGKVAAVATIMTVAGLFYVQSASATDSIQGNMTMGEAIAPSKIQATQGGIAPVKPSEIKDGMPSAKKPCKLPKKPKKPVNKPPVSSQPKVSPTSEPNQAIMGKIAAPRE